jgi:hypothetical protein
MGQGFGGHAREDVARQERCQNRAQHRQLDLLDASFPDLGLEHRHALEDHDPAERGVEARVQEGRQTGADARPWFLCGERGGHDRRDDIGLDGLVHGAEQRVLAAEVMVQSPLRDTRTLDDVLDRGRRVALVGEPLAGDCDEELAGGFRLAFPQPLDSHRHILHADQ